MKQIVHNIIVRKKIDLFQQCDTSQFKQTKIRRTPNSRMVMNKELCV